MVRHCLNKIRVIIKANDPQRPTDLFEKRSLRVPETRACKCVRCTHLSNFFYNAEVFSTTTHFRDSFVTKSGMKLPRIIISIKNAFSLQAPTTAIFLFFLHPKHYSRPANTNPAKYRSRLRRQAFHRRKRIASEQCQIDRKRLAGEHLAGY